MRLIKSFCVIAVCLIFTTIVYGQQQGKKSNTDRIKLVSADSLISITKNSETVTILIGNAKLTQGDALILCDKAWFNDKAQTAELKTHVTIFDGKRTLKADYVFYNGKTRVETAEGNVSLLTNKRILRTSKLTYNQKDMVVTVSDNVIIEDFIKSVTLRSRKAKYNRKKDYSQLWSNVNIVKTDSAAKDTISIRGKRAEAWGDEQKVIVSDSVKITRSRLRAVCGTACYSADPASLKLNKNPVVWIDNQRLKGDEIFLRLKGLSFQGGVVTGSAEIAVKDSATGKDDFMSGDTIYIDARNDTIYKVDIRSQAVSIYHINNEEEEPGVNNVTGDRIELYFNSLQKLERVLILSSPGVCSGKYTPVNAVLKKKSKKLLDSIIKRKKLF